MKDSRTVTRVLTDHGRSEYFSVLRKSIVLRQSLWVSVIRWIPGANVIQELIWGIKCWLVSQRYDRHIPIVTVGHGHGFVFAFLQYILSPIVPMRTHVMFDFLLNRKGRGLARIYEQVKFKVFNQVVDLAVVWGETDIKTFSEEYNIPAEKLIFHPHHITLESYTFDIKQDGFIFAGGNGGRDYPTLIEAVKTLDCPVFIATTQDDVPALASEYGHITVRGVSHEEFRVRMAACTMFVEAHDPDFFRTAGHQTFLNAMWMGKPVVLADRKSAVGYIEDGVDGLIVNAGDSNALRNAIQTVLDDSELANRLGLNAKEKLQQPKYTTLNCMQSIYNIAIELSCKKSGTDPKSQRIEMY